MTRRKRFVSDGHDNDINLTPMLDVVFIMLIFFIVTATFIRETGLEANRSEEKLEIEAEAKAALVAIGSGDEIRIDGQIVDPRSVRAHLERSHAQNPDWPVVIEPHGSSTTKMLVAVMDAARLGGIENIAIAGK